MTRELFAAALHAQLSDRVLRDLTLSDAFAQAHSAADIVACLEPLVPDEKRLALSRLPLDREAEALAETFDRKGIRVVLASSEEYPPTLRGMKRPPPVLYAQGDPAVMQKAGFGICGSRKASGRGIEIAGWFGAEVARLGVPEVSGYAKGVDTAAHLSALEAGGATVAVLAEGIFHFRRKREFAGLPGVVERMVVVSEFPPSRQWSAHGAMQRNATICGLSDAMVVVEAQATGGTLNAGLECLKQSKPLFVAQFGEDVGTPAPEGNLELIKRGGIPVNSPSELAERLNGVKERRAAEATPPVRQLELSVSS